MTGINALIRETLKSEHTPSARWVDGEKVPSMKPSLDIKSACTNPEPPASRTVRNKVLLF